MVLAQMATGIRPEKRTERQMKILLLAGGNSSENQVSLNTGAAIFDSLKRLGHEVLPIDPATGRSLIGTDGTYQNQLPPGETTTLTTTGSRALTAALASPVYRNIDLVFIALHGGEGENGTIQALLDLSGIKYTGSGMAASAIAMNKAITKRLFTSAQIPTPDWELYHLSRELPTERIVESVRKRFSLPVIVKPNDGGSTVGLTKVKSIKMLPDAIDICAHESREVLVEQFIAGREMTVAVVDGKALPVVEIRPKNELYDYEAKYTKGKSEYLAPAPIDDAFAVRMQEYAETAFELIGASGLVRVDFILSPDGTPYCLEVNTLPGMTNLSLAPMAAKCAGISFDQLIERIVASALRS
ncbi:MAG: D-alanine--D-alanine ligase [Candidatus Zixiibacteriota bacterium]